MPRAGVVSESKDNRLGGGLTGRSDMKEYTAGLQSLAIGVFTGESEAAFRHDRVGLPGDPGTLRDSAKALTLTNHVFLEGPGAFSSDVSVTNRRSRRLERDRWNEYKSDLVSFSSLFQPFDNAVNHRFRYELSATRSQVLVDVYEPAGEGLGTHARDSLSGDYIEKEGGNYRYAGTRVDTQSSEQAVNASEISSRLTLAFGRFNAVKGGAGLLRDLMSDTYLLLSEEKLADAYERAGLSVFRQYVPEVLPSGVEGSRTAKYRLDFKQELTLHPPSDAFVLRLRFHPRFRFDYRHTGGDAFEKDEWQSRHYSIYGRYAVFSRLTLEHEPSVEWIDRKKDLSESAFDILNRRLFNQATLVAARVLSFPLAVTIGRSDNRHPQKPLEVPYAVVKPGIAATWPEKGRVELNYEFLYVKTNEKYLYYEMAEGNPAGRTHRVTLSARSAFFKNMESDLQYRGEKEESAGRWAHRGSAQLKAYF
jgi:hypothetical protein